MDFMSGGCELAAETHVYRDQGLKRPIAAARITYVTLAIVTWCVGVDD
jgi:hypothetical protein